MGYARIHIDSLEGKPLSPRERQVLQLIAYGFNKTQIAERLGTTRNTVETQTGHLLGKLGARNMANAVALAYEEGLLGRE